MQKLALQVHPIYKQYHAGNDATALREYLTVSQGDLGRITIGTSARQERDTLKMFAEGIPNQMQCHRIVDKKLVETSASDDHCQPEMVKVESSFDGDTNEDDSDKDDRDIEEDDGEQQVPQKNDSTFDEDSDHFTDSGVEYPPRARRRGKRKSVKSASTQAVVPQKRNVSNRTPQKKRLHRDSGNDQLVPQLKWQAAGKSNSKKKATKKSLAKPNQEDEPEEVILKMICTVKMCVGR